MRQLAATVRLLMRLHSEWALPNITGGNHKINREGVSQSRFEAKTAMDAPVKIPEASLPGPLSAASPRAAWTLSQYVVVLLERWLV